MKPRERESFVYRGHSSLSRHRHFEFNISRKMMQQPEKQLSVTWRGKKFIIVMDQGANLKELGDKLQKLTNVKTDTLRLIVPTDKGSKLLYPFSNEHSYLPLEAASTLEGKPIRMMGVPENEVDEILQNAKTDLRIAGFDEEEKRMRRRIFDERNSFVQLPQGTYVFSEFRTLSIPGIELSPPASEALKLMHRLAADPGIVAIMEKHRWRVGIMTEMAPVGYVGVSPKCILGFNKNHGEEISLRLRTDDLNGFRKYESIKKTLLHELAHMVYSEHDADFYALDKQLNQEAAALDWTKTKGHTLNGVRHALNSEEEYDNRVSLSRKLGGQGSGFSNARASSVAAAYHRFANTSTDGLRGVSTHEEPDPDDSGCTVCQKHDCLHAGGKTEVGLTDRDNHTEVEPDPDDSLGGDAMESESCLGCGEIRVSVEPDPDDSEELKAEANEESAHSNLEVRDGSKVGQNFSEATETTKGLNQPKVIHLEPDPDDSQAGSRLLMKPSSREPDPDDSWASVVVESELEPDDNMMVSAVGMSMGQVNEPDPDDMELQRIQDPVAAVYSHLQKAMEMLRSEVDPLDAAAVLQTLVKIIRNVIEHPDEMKFKKIRKANAIIRRNILHYGAAVEILRLVGFSEDVVFDEMGIAETYLVLKRNDPGLLWLVKNSLESYNA